MTELRFDRDPAGRLQVWTHASASRVLLRKCADALVDGYGADGRDRVEGMGQVFWDFMAGPIALTLHFDRDKGIAVCANDVSAASETFVKAVAERLRTLREDDVHPSQ